MKKILLVFLLTCSCLDCSAQFGDKQIITTTIDRPRYIYPSDINGDGNLDFLVTDIGEKELYWFENIDGQGNFSSANVIASGYQGTNYPSDINGDGDMDVLYIDGGEIGWLENIDGNGTFSWREILHGSAVNGPIFASDIDEDGDLDVISGTQFDLIWFENIDGAGNFGSAQIIDSKYGYLTRAIPGDIDEDGDIDIIIASFNPCECQNPVVAWYENIDGLGNFGERQVFSTDFIIHQAVEEIIAFDGDQDGDIDIFTITRNVGTPAIVAWSENIDSQGTFAAAQIISISYGFSAYIRAFDIDNNGSLELLVHEVFEGFRWYGYDGQGNFELQGTLQNFRINTFHLGDFDNNGYVDIIGADTDTNNTGKIFWFKNSGSLSLNETTKLDFSIIPNPTTGPLNIESEIKIDQITITNELGQIVLFIKNTNFIDISNLSEGLYFMQMKDKQDNFGMKKIIKE